MERGIGWSVAQAGLSVVIGPFQFPARVFIKSKDLCASELATGLAEDCPCAIAGRQNDGDHLVGAELLAQGPPRGVDIAIQKSLLDGRQQMVGQNAEENVGLGATLQMMEDGPLH